MEIVYLLGGRLFNNIQVLADIRKDNSVTPSFVTLLWTAAYQKSSKNCRLGIHNSAHISLLVFIFVQFYNLLLGSSSTFRCCWLSYKSVRFPKNLSFETCVCVSHLFGAYIRLLPFCNGPFNSAVTHPNPE